jgi:hypothetical protein
MIPVIIGFLDDKVLVFGDGLAFLLELQVYFGQLLADLGDFRFPGSKVFQVGLGFFRLAFLETDASAKATARFSGSEARLF